MNGVDEEIYFDELKLLCLCWWVCAFFHFDHANNSLKQKWPINDTNRQRFATIVGWFVKVYNIKSVATFYKTLKQYKNRTITGDDENTSGPPFCTN